MKSLHEFSEKAGKFGFMEEGSDGPKSSNDKDKGWGAVNYLLGFVTFGLVIYFMMLLRSNKSGGGGGTGWGGGKSGGLFGKKGGK